MLLAHSFVPALVRGSYCTSCGEACLDNICQTCFGSNRERKDWSAFSKPWKSSYRLKDAEKWSFVLFLLLLASLSGCPDRRISFQKTRKHTFTCISAIPSLPALLQPHNGISISSPLLSTSYLLQKQRFINYSHLLVSCVRARVRVEVLCACQRVVD